MSYGDKSNLSWIQQQMDYILMELVGAIFTKTKNSNSTFHLNKNG